MTNVTSDAVETIRVDVDTTGSLDRPRLVVPEGQVPETVVRVVADERTYHAPVERAISGDLEITGLYGNTRLARERAGENLLPTWLSNHNLSAGRSAHLDVVVDGEQYGLRAPGDRAVYHVVESTNDSLQSIAETLDSE